MFQPKEQNLQPWAISQQLWWTFSLKKGRFYQCQPPSQPESSQQPTSELYFTSASSPFLVWQSPLSYFSSYLLSSYCYKFITFSFRHILHHWSHPKHQDPVSCHPSCLTVALLMLLLLFLFSPYTPQRKRSSGYQKTAVICASKAFSRWLFKCS